MFLDNLSKGLSGTVGKSTAIAAGFAGMVSTATPAQAHDHDVDLQTDAQYTQVIESDHTPKTYQELWEDSTRAITSIPEYSHIDFYKIGPADVYDKEHYEKTGRFQSSNALSASKLREVYEHVNNGELSFSQESHVQNVEKHTPQRQEITGVPSPDRVLQLNGDSARYTTYKTQDDEKRATCVIQKTQPFLTIEQKEKMNSKLPDLEPSIEHKDITLADYDISTESSYAFVLDHELAHCIFREGNQSNGNHSLTEQLPDAYAALRSIQRGDVETVEFMRDVRAISEKRNPTDNHKTAYVLDDILQSQTPDTLKDLSPEEMVKLTLDSVEKSRADRYTEYRDPGKVEGFEKEDEQIYQVAKKRMTAEKPEPLIQTVVNELHAEGGQELVTKYLGRDGEEMTPNEVAAHYLKTEVMPEIERNGSNAEEIDFYLKRAQRVQEARLSNPEIDKIEFSEIPADIALDAVKTVIKGREQTQSLELEQLAPGIIKQQEAEHSVRYEMER